MGGLIRAGSTSRIWFNGKEDNALFLGNNKVWTKPLRSSFNNPGVTVTDDIIGIGSSDMGCIHYHTWSTQYGPHAWYPLFRASYAGDLFEPTTDGAAIIPGSNITNLIYGRTDLHTIQTAARGGQFTENAEDIMDRFNAILFEFSDLNTAIQMQELPAIVQATPSLAPGYNTNPQMFAYPYFQSQYHINLELKALLDYIREARANGINRMYLCAPWPRLPAMAAGTDDSHWRTRLDGLETFMNYLQDRVNYQLNNENLGGHISMVPYHRLFRRIWDDIEDGNIPAVTPELNHFRMLFANESQTGDPLSIVPNKHWYMLNHWGTYAINCMYSYVVLGVDPRGISNSAGNYTVPQALATYFQNIAVEETNSFPRAGKRRTGDVGFVLPTIRDQTPAQIMGAARTVCAFSDINLTTGQRMNTNTARGARHFFVCLEADASFDPDVPSNPFNAIFSLVQSNDQMSLYFSPNRFDLGAGQSEGIMAQHNINRGYSDAGVRKFFYEIRLYPNGQTNLQGFNTTFMSLNSHRRYEDYPYSELDFASAIAHNQPTATPVVGSRIESPSDGITIRSFISSTEILSDGETLNMWRHLSKVHQCNTWDLFTPDMI